MDKYTTIHVENLKCNGCANTIRKELGKFETIKEIKILPEDSLVVLALDEEAVELEAIKDKLAAIGYPEYGKNSFLTAARSYVSCVVGRMGTK